MSDLKTGGKSIWRHLKVVEIWMEVGAVGEGWIGENIGVEMIIEGEEVDETDGTITTVTVITAHVKTPLDVEVPI